MALDDIENTLTDKVGPFPVWGWGVALGGVAVAFMFLNRGGGEVADGSTTTDPGASGSDTGLTTSDILDNNDQDLWTGNDQGDNSDQTPIVNNYYNSDGTPAKPPTTTVMTKQLWFNKALAYEVGKGHSPLAVQTVLSNYLSGKPITPAGAAVINDVLAHFGRPPGTSISFHATVTQPAPHGGTQAPKGLKWYTVDGNDTQASIVKHFWGSASNAHVAAFRRANGLTTGSHLHKGQKVKVKA